MDPTWTEALEDGPIPKTYAEWVDCLARPKRWVDEHMLAVGATLMQRSIVVFVWSANSWQKGWVIDPTRSFRKACKEVASKPPLPVLLKSRHYTTLLKKAEPWPAEWSDLPVHRRPASQLRGAGKSRTPSLSSWVPPTPRSEKSRRSKQSEAASEGWLPATPKASAQKRKAASECSLRSWVPRTPAPSNKDRDNTVKGSRKALSPKLSPKPGMKQLAIATKGASSSSSSMKVLKKQTKNSKF